MNNALKQLLYWIPRIAGILFVLFLSIFAFDVFEMQLGFWGTLLALFVHLLPSILLTVGVLFGWRREWVGAVLFLGWAVWYVASARGFGWTVYLLIAGIPTIIGLLFLAGWVWRGSIRARG
jgi:hypothetical protein